MKKILFLGLFLLTAGPCLAEMISVIHQPAELRDRAMVSGSKIIRQLPRYTPLEVLDSKSDYLHVKDAEGRTGYIHRSLARKTPSVAITAGECNVRSGPGTEFPVVFKASKGNSYKALGKERDWVQISTVDGKIGWIWQNLIWGY